MEMVGKVLCTCSCLSPLLHCLFELHLQSKSSKIKLLRIQGGNSRSFYQVQGTSESGALCNYTYCMPMNLALEATDPGPDVVPDASLAVTMYIGY